MERVGGQEENGMYIHVPVQSTFNPISITFHSTEHTCRIT